MTNQRFVQKIWKYRILLALSVSAAAFLVYLPALRNDFVNWDDDLYVYENQHISSIDMVFLKWAFSDFYGSNWHPLTWMSHAMDCTLWGLNPVGHHLTNIILHAVNTFLVVILVSRLSESSEWITTGGTAAGSYKEMKIMIMAGVTGLLFGLHPLHVESVAWIAERKDLLCALFTLASIIVYANYVKAKTRVEAKTTLFSRFFDKRYLIALGIFALALLSKPMAMTLPAVLLVLDWYPFKRIHSIKTFLAACVEKVPFLFLSLLSMTITFLAQRAGESMVPMVSLPFSNRVIVAVHSLGAYLWQMIVPLGLLPFYPHPKHVSLLSLNYILATGFVIAITIFCFWMKKRQKIWLSVWGYYFVTLIPVLGIVQVGGQSMADRYTYLPSVGPFLIIGMLAARFSITAEKGKQEAVTFHPVYPFVVLLVLYFIMLSCLTVKQIGIWRNSIVLWSTVIEKEPAQVPLAYYNRGQAFMNQRQIERAIKDYTAATVLNPFYHEAFYNRGLAFEMIGQQDLAIEDYEKAISLNSNNYQAYNNRGVLYGKTGLYDKAVEYFNRSLAINPAYPDAYFNRGFTYTLKGRPDDALADFDKAIGLYPQFAPAYFHRGNLHLRMGRKRAAAVDFRKACELGIREACSVVP